MNITEFVQSTDFTATEKLIIVYMLYKNNRNFSSSLRELQELIGVSYVTAQKSLKNLANKGIVLSFSKRDNSPTYYAILLD